MFKSGQDQALSTKNHPKTAIYNYGMTLVKKRSMNRNFTYRELTVILGILVALLVVFTFWYKTPDFQSLTPSFTTPASSPVTFSSIKSLILSVTGIGY
jgi:hypothetical protein